MQVLVDGDIFVYRAGFATEYPKYTVVLDDDSVKEYQYKKDAVAFIGDLDYLLLTETVLEPEVNAIHIVDSMLGDIAYHFGVQTRDLDLVITGKGNFRDDVAFTKPYKGNRKKPKPTHYDAIRYHMVTTLGATVVDGEEADDYLGYMQYSRALFGDPDTVIVTIDKDLDMIMGRHYNPVRREEYYVNEEDADRFFLIQLITGDSTDNIPGIPGLGAVGAEKALDGVPNGEAVDVIRKLYTKAYGDKGEAVFDEQAALLWIRRMPYQSWENYWEGVTFEES
jgi:hypothetical protein